MLKNFDLFIPEIKKETENNSYTLITSFYRPMGINIDDQENLYIAEFDSNGNNRVLKLNNEYKFTGQLGRQHPVQTTWIDKLVPQSFFNKPHSIDFGISNCLYIADYGNKRILKFSKEGQLMDVFYGQLKGPATAYFGKNQLLYISDFISHIIFICNDKFDLINTIQLDFKNPHSARFDHYGNMYVVDTWNHCIKKFQGDIQYAGWIGMDTDGIIKQEWSPDKLPMQTSMDGGFNAPTAIDFDEKGNLYISEYGNHRIQIFSNEGKYLSSIKGLNTPYDLKIKNNKLYIADSHNRRIIIHNDILKL